jgi:glucose-6-phosphate 1-dehydrogenase
VIGWLGLQPVPALQSLRFLPQFSEGCPAHPPPAMPQRLQLAGFCYNLSMISQSAQGYPQGNEKPGEASGGVNGRYRKVRGCELEIPDPFCLVIFGASGDLAQRKILPSLYRLYIHELLPDRFFILGAARSDMGESAFRELMMRKAQTLIPEDFSRTRWEEFAARMYYLRMDYEKVESCPSLQQRITFLEERHHTQGNRIFYLAVPPDIYEPVASNLGSSGLSRGEGGYAHIVIEKPIGRDLESAKRLNAVLGGWFRESQVYRMDHYLAKETVQNILMLRFANSIFEPMWNRSYIDHVQITVSETIGVELRSGYYERAGVLRDMFQNHLLQLLALTAMEPPPLFEAERVRDEKMKVLCSIRNFAPDRSPESAVLGQYGEGRIGALKVPAYREEQGIGPDSMTATFAAVRLFVDNWRWNGVPFYLRSGKRLTKRKAEISVHFKQVPHLLFSSAIEKGIEPNVLVMRVQPKEGVNLIFQAKTPGSRVCLSPVDMDYSYGKTSTLTDYERVLLDCMQGDQMLFVREDGVERAWELFMPLIEWAESDRFAKDFPNYAAGSDGPREARLLIEGDGRRWRRL